MLQIIRKQVLSNLIGLILRCNVRIESKMLLTFIPFCVLLVLEVEVLFIIKEILKLNLRWWLSRQNQMTLTSIIQFIAFLLYTTVRCFWKFLTIEMLFNSLLKTFPLPNFPISSKFVSFSSLELSKIRN